MDYKILAFGDSITYGFNDPEGGWVARLRKDLDSVNKRSDSIHTVFNLGISGDKTADLLKRLESESKPRLSYENDYRLIVAIGTNDAIQSVENGRPEVNDEEFKKNYRQILTLAKKLVPKTYACLATPVDDRVWPMEWAPGRGYKNERIDWINSTIRELAKEAGISVIDTHSEFTKRNPNELLDDGAHPNAKGHELIYQTVKKALDL